MNNRIPAGEDTVSLIKSLAERSLKAMAELELINTELQGRLHSEAEALGIKEKVMYYDFNTHEYVMRQDLSEGVGGEENESIEGVGTNLTEPAIE